MHPLGVKVMTWSSGLFGAAMFASCVVYGLVVPAAFHAPRLLEAILPGFRWLSPASFLLGLGETALYGAYAGLVFTLIHDLVLRRYRGGRPSPG